MIEAPTGSGWYVYGVAEDDPALGRLDGVELIRHGSLAAVARGVPLDEYGADVLPERLNDREWLERTAREHETVLQAAAAVSTVVPLRFGTIYQGREHVELMLEERGEEFRSSLERVRGHVELGVKVWVDLATLGETFDGDEQPLEDGTGAAYLRQRRREQEHSLELKARCVELAEEAHDHLSRVAVSAVSNRPQPRELTGRSESMVLNGAYLVPDGDERLRSEVDRLTAEHPGLGIEYELTGPWPPHNFAGEPE